jgi:hypothetical protein
MRWFLTIVLLAVAASVSNAQEPEGKCNPSYQNHNMIDYGPLVLRNLSGQAIDPTSAEVRGGCLGLFSEEGHRLIAATEADQNGNFAFPQMAPGRYRLVADCAGFCVANVPLRIVRWPRGRSHRKLVLHMKMAAIDACSYGDYK